ncbi:Uncharacterised protein [Bordetella ansorpii]|uniref:DNA binding HTH domain-containing protein n=1 Tax=Bordetella ansorpii TaxID=288768 RepID=A0A157NL67_9BORD|nr:helix-turn-helix domain-containing protein [Bordetella ansorpii]SAI21830.1 Uncharacterised protein [Bordetella ansorpii]
MRECFECALLVAPEGAAGAASWVQPELSGERLRLQAHALAECSAPDADPASLIAAASLHLQRYDACLLPVEPSSLQWVRLALLRAQGVLRIPVLVLSHEVKAPALADLLALGAADFLRAPLCTEELRARLLRIVARRGARSEPTVGYPAPRPPDGGGWPGVTVQEAMPAYSRVGRAAYRTVPGHTLPGMAARPMPTDTYPRGHIGSRRFTGNADSDCATVRPRARQHDDTAEAKAPPTFSNEPFRQAKARVVDGFEQDYLRQALQRHQGNVAQAAKASNKHRRAFWALMRKHRIEAAPYRVTPQAQAS